MAFAAQHGEHFVIVMVDSQLSNAVNKGCRIADCVRSIWRKLELERFGCAALPANMQFNHFRGRPFHNGNVDKRSMRLRSRGEVVDADHNRGKFLASCRICRFCSAVTARKVFRSKAASSSSRS